MPCEPFCYKDENGNIVSGIMCSRGRKQRVLCHVCGRPSTSLCDYPIGNGKTCDRPMCERCKTTIGHDLDVCREHNNPTDIAKTKIERERGQNTALALATTAQRDYIKSLCDKLGYDCDDYLSVDLTKQAASKIITELKEEWEG